LRITKDGMKNKTQENQGTIEQKQNKKKQAPK
jgi:hypothetical protein